MRKVLAILLFLAAANIVSAQQKQALSTASSSCTATSCLSVTVDQTQGGATFTITANASGNTIQFEASGDGGTTRVPINVTPSNSTTAVTSTTGTGTWQANTAGYTNVYMRMSNLVGGTTTVSIIQSTASARAGGGGGGSGTIGGSIAATQVAFGSGANTIAGDANLTYVAASPNQLFSIGCTPQSVDMSEICGEGSISGTVTGNSTFNDLYAWQNNNIITINSPNTTSTKYIGSLNSFDGEGSGTFTDASFGGVGSENSASYGTNGTNPAGSMALLIGTDSTAQNGSTLGTVTSLIGVRAQRNLNNGTVTNNYGFFASDQHGIGSTLNAAYYAPDQGAGANDYALFLAGGKAHSVGQIDSNSGFLANADGIHPGNIALVGNTTVVTPATNTFNIMGPASAAFTAYALQFPNAAPAAGNILQLGAPSSAVSQATYTATPTLGVDNSVAGTLTLANSAAAAHTIFASGATTTNTLAGPATVPVTNTLLKCTTASTTCTLAATSLTDNATAVVGTEPIRLAAGAQATPSYSFSASTGDGFYSRSAGIMDLATSGTATPVELFAGGVRQGSNGVLGFTNTSNNAALSFDTGISRGAAGYVTFGTGAAGNTAAFTKSAMTVTTAADVTCGTGGTIASCTAATTITGLSITLPLVATNWTFECQGVVSQATGVVANQWLIQTATNGATSTTASYIMGTAATAMAVGAVTDQASTTTAFQITPSWTLGGTGTKMPFHIWGTITGASASGTVFNLQVINSNNSDLLTIYEGASCSLRP